MTSAGVIVEYNPFHNGHLHHLNETKKAANADVIVAVMSGSFLQRGEPALVDKWTRTQMALKNGIDLVVELPYVYATQKAEIFAKGAISILNSLGVDYVCFGSESGDIEEFQETASFIEMHEKDYNERIKYYMGQGNSYPKASSLAFESLEGHAHVLDLSKPNNILGYHYVKAIQAQNALIEPLTILRTKAGYHDQDFVDKRIASATGIRRELFKGSSLDQIQAYVPEPTYFELTNYQQTYDSFQGWHKLYHLLRYKLLTSSNVDLSSIYEAEEGLENRLATMAKQAQTFQSFMELVKTKRYTWTRIQRLALHILTQTSKNDMLPALENKDAPYVRILGMTKAGRSFLNERKNSLPVPLVSNINQFDHPFLAVERRASQVYALGYSGFHQEAFLQKEHKSVPIMID
ncbi:nucleotidyltransferase [Pseudalkalibacillus hwajinpoensis]|uniref:nucleotidyltransferase n=1 Tax=Guptibacillus hwajinpoensis TaxID=208199 RepID=UPI00384C95AE